MRNLTEEILELLPYSYTKEEASNNYKLVQLMAKVIGNIIKHQQQIRSINDIDNAEGKILDLIGSNYSQLREPGQSDDEYRLYIKTKIAADMSQGDIETLNEIATAALGDNFIGIIETWSSEIYKDDIAGIVVKVKPEIQQLPNILNRVRAAGIKLYYEMLLKDEEVIIEHKEIQFKARYPMTHEARVGSRPVDGNSNQVKVEPGYIKIKTNYSMAGQTTTAAVKNNISQLENILEIKEAKGGARYPMTHQAIVGGN